MNNEELIKLAKQGDEDAKDTLFQNNQEFIYKMAHKYRNIAEFDDLVSMGNVGLIKAFNTYDESKGLKFITYYSRIVVNEILMHHRKTKNHKYVKSLDEVVMGEGLEDKEITRMDLLIDEESEAMYEKVETHNFMNQVLNVFKVNENPRLVKILEKCIIQNMKQVDVANDLHMSQSHVSRLERQVRNSLKDYGLALIE